MLQKGKKGDMMSGGKKGGMNGGKKGDMIDDDCIDGTIEITSCGTTISQPGCYILTDNLMCGEGQDGFTITADDVHLDSQDFENRGLDPATNPNVGIGVNSVDHVTVANCGAANFVVGLLAAELLTDLTVSKSSFNNNPGAGMFLNGDNGSPSDITVVDSTFNGNGNSVEGYGILSKNFSETISSSTMNNNIGPLGGGLVHRGTGTLTLVDVEAIINQNYGLFAEGMATLNVVDSLACFNGDIDIVNPTCAQGNTCGTSTPATIAGLPVCQLAC
jgi:hypothetical protein